MISLAIFFVLLACGAGYVLGSHLDRYFWNRYGYCPTCDRLRSDQTEGENR